MEALQTQRVTLPSSTNDIMRCSQNVGRARARGRGGVGKGKNEHASRASGEVAVFYTARKRRRARALALPDWEGQSTASQVIK